MTNQTDTKFVLVSQEAEEILALGRKRHERYRILTEFRGMIEKPVFNAQGDWVYMPLREDDKAIIPKAAYRRHDAVKKAGFRVAQVIIGHEVKIIPDKPITSPKPKREIDWENVADIAARGVLIGMTGIAMVALYTLTGVFQLVDPSYCIVLDDGQGTVIELIRWNAEV